MKRPTRGTLAWRLYVVGVAQLVFVAAAAVIVGALMTRSSLARPGTAVGEAVAARLRPVADDHAALIAELRELHDHGEVDVSIYDDAHHVIATNVEPPVPWGAPPAMPPRSMGEPQPPAPSEAAPAEGRGAMEGPPTVPPPDSDRRSMPPHMGFAKIEIAGHSAEIAVRPRHGGPSPLPPILTFVAGLIVVALGAVLTARWIMKPLTELSRAARALGAGDLRARTGFVRSDEVGEVGRAFDEMAERVQRLLLAEKELLANVSHELRTPLARIRVALDLAAEGDADAARTSIAEIAVDLAELESLIDDIMTAARVDLGEGNTTTSTLALHLEATTPRWIGDRTVERFSARHPRRTLGVSIDDDLPKLVVDPVLFRRVIDNLVENADRYSPDERSPIMIRARATGGAVVFDVIDEGMGIAAEDLPRVFTPFFRAERSRSRAAGGVGLGLTLARRIVEAHGGSIAITSHAGAGTTVSVTMPVSIEA